MSRDVSYTLQDAFDVASRKVSVPGWQGYRWQSVVGGCVVRGQVPNGAYTKGKRKGSPRFTQHKDAARCDVYVSDADLLAAAARFEEETGLCWDCKGTGQIFSGWSQSSGVRYRPCRKCATSKGEQ